MENGTIPTELFPVDKTDPTVTTEGPKKDFPVERTIGIVSHLRTYAKSRQWRYVNKEVPGMGPGSTGRDACLFFALDSQRPTAFDPDTSTWAVWAGNGPPDCDPFEAWPASPLARTAPETEKVEADETTTCVGDVKVPPPGSIRVTMGDGTDKWMSPKELEEKILKQAPGVRMRWRVPQAGTVDSVRDTLQRIKEIEHARSGFTTIPQRPVTPGQLHDFGLEIYRAGKALMATATKLNLVSKTAISSMLQELEYASNQIHAEASKIELEVVRKALDAKK